MITKNLLTNNDPRSCSEKEGIE